MPTLQIPFATPQERKAGRDDPGQIFEAGGTHDKVVYAVHLIMKIFCTYFYGAIHWILKIFCTYIFFQ